jgi:hypothetical protein
MFVINSETMGNETQCTLLDSPAETCSWMNKLRTSWMCNAVRKCCNRADVRHPQYTTSGSLAWAGIAPCNIQNPHSLLAGYIRTQNNETALMTYCKPSPVIMFTSHIYTSVTRGIFSSKFSILCHFRLHIQGKNYPVIHKFSYRKCSAVRHLKYL